MSLGLTPNPNEGDVGWAGTVNGNFDTINNAFPVALTQGGTGIDASGATDGQLLIGRSSDHTLQLATLTAGTNVTITNSGAGITIASSGGGGGTTGVGGWPNAVWSTGGTFTATNPELLGPTDNGMFLTAGSTSAGNGLTLSGGAATGATAGGLVQINGGSSASGTGGGVTLAGGSVSTSGVGGAITLSPSAGVGTNMAGGALTGTAGAATGTAAGGSVTLTAGHSVTGAAGAVTLTAGAGGSTSGAGGIASLTGGAGTAGNAAGGAANLTGGAGQGTAAGGVAQVTGGAAGATGTGGAASVVGGVGVAGPGGSVSIVGGAGVGSNKASGGVVIDMGNSSGNATENITFKGPPTGSSGSGTNTSVSLVQITNKGSTVTNAAGSTIAQSATDGFLYVPVCATGAPSGTPTAFTGAAAVVVGGDNNLYARMGSAWIRVNAGPSAFDTSTTSNSAAITNTTTAIAGGSSGTIIPANALKAGSAFRFVITGTVAATASAVQVFSLYFGSNGTTADTQIATFSINSQSSLGVAERFHLVAEAVVVTAGSSGSIAGNASVNNQVTSGIVNSQVALVGMSPVASSLNTTNAGYFTLAYNSASANVSLVAFAPATLEIIKF